MDNHIPSSGDQPTRKFDAVRIGKNKADAEKTVSNRPDSGAGKPVSNRPKRGVDADHTGGANGKKSPKSAKSAKAVKEPKAKKPKKKRRKLTPEQKKIYRRRRIVRLVVILIVVAASWFVSTFVISCMNDIIAINRSTDKVSVSVNDGMTTDQVIDLLAEKDLIENPDFCKLFAQIRGYDNTKYITSVYELQASYGLEKLLISMSKNAASAETVTLSFPEGFCMEQIFAKLEENGVCSAASLRATAREMDFSGEYPFLKNIPNKEQRFYVLEGYMYPDTYEFYLGENAASVIKRFLSNFEKHWTEEYSNTGAGLGLSVDDVIKIASIIEKEAYGTKQMYQISSVLHNRLWSGNEEFKYLQCDSTSGYISYIPETVLSGDLRVSYTKLYDTYQCVGLPAAPICSPGDNAIKAALRPESTDYYYFRHDVNKKIYLAETKEGHDKNGEEVFRVNAKAKESESAG